MRLNQAGMTNNIVTGFYFSIHLKAPYTENYYYFGKIKKVAITYERADNKEALLVFSGH